MAGSAQPASAGSTAPGPVVPAHFRATAGPLTESIFRQLAGSTARPVVPVAPRPQNYTMKLCATGHATQSKVTGFTNPRPNPIGRHARNGSSAMQHFNHAISSDIAIMHNREIKTAEQLAHHRLYDTRDHRATHIIEKDSK